MRRLTVSSFIAISLWLAPSHQARSQSYNWSTIAGFPLASSVVDGTNTQVRFNYPQSVALSSAGVFYVGDVSSIRQATPVGTNWVVRTITGGSVYGAADGTNGAAQFNNLAGIAVDSATNLYVADFNNDTIRKVAPVGTNWVVTTIAGMATVSGSSDGTNSDASFYEPWGIAMDPAGGLLVADYGNLTIRRLAPVGTNWVVSTIAGVAGAWGTSDGTNNDARFTGPQGITLSSDGGFYIGDVAAIRKLTPVGTSWVVSTIAGLPSTTGSIDGTNSDARFCYPSGVTGGEAGNLYVADTLNNLIRKIVPLGTNWVVTTIGGRFSFTGDSQDGIGTSARFFWPNGIAVDGDGNLFVTDYGNCTLRLGLGSLVTLPSLEIAVAGPQTVVSWPLAATNYSLEASGTALSSAPWTAVTDGVTQNGTRFVLTTNPTGEPAFFRLHSQ